MTRDEAIAAVAEGLFVGGDVTWTRPGETLEAAAARRSGFSRELVDGLAALGLLKLEKPDKMSVVKEFTAKASALHAAAEALEGLKLVPDKPGAEWVELDWLNASAVVFRLIHKGFKIVRA